MTDTDPKPGSLSTWMARRPEHKVVCLKQPYQVAQADPRLDPEISEDMIDWPSRPWNPSPPSQLMPPGGWWRAVVELDGKRFRVYFNRGHWQKA